ncbi:hypothetical protein ACFFGV_04160 [Pontibacillus salicampi]|uniref:Uncharacterized protein n=1 Tax=Pontibacillus salicampi TaxID=1449801 RepID=A0ABV6LK97_9BACI
MHSDSQSSQWMEINLFDSSEEWESKWELINEDFRIDGMWKEASSFFACKQVNEAFYNEIYSDGIPKETSAQAKVHRLGKAKEIHSSPHVKNHTTSGTFDLLLENRDDAQDALLIQLQSELHSPSNKEMTAGSKQSDGRDIPLDEGLSGWSAIAYII